jgi:hypothetical protein
LSIRLLIKIAVSLAVLSAIFLLLPMSARR